MFDLLKKDSVPTVSIVAKAEKFYEIDVSQVLGVSQFAAVSLIDRPPRHGDDKIDNTGVGKREQCERGGTMRHCVPWMVAGVLLAGASAVMAEATNDEEAAYTRSITERADKIVAPLAIDDAAKATRVRDLIVEQYRALRDIHAERDARLAQAKGQPSDPTIAEAWRSVTQKEVDLKLFALHRRFLARLAAELSPENVDQVKEGMTYGVVQITYGRYRELLPALTVQQQADILAMLLEAREYAMDAGSSDEKHAIFGKYKGRINNYLSAAGYNMKQAEQDWTARQKAAGSSQ